MEMIDTAIILAGGLGTRLRPLTYNIPKPLLPIKGQPIVEHAIKNMAQQGIKKIILSIGYKSETIQEYFGDGKKWGVHISYSLESNPLGTGGAIKKALGNLNQPVFVVWGDNLMDINYRELNSIHQKYKKLVTMVLTEREDVENFGVAKLEGERIISFVEKQKREDAPSNLINAGAIVLEPQGVKKIPQEQFSIEYDYYEKLKPGEIIAFIHKGQWFPTDTLEKYKHAEDNFKPKL